MRQRDIDRKLFGVGHYEVIAARFRHALEPYMQQKDALALMDGKVDNDTVIAMSIRSALVVLAVDFAKRLQADNSDFDPVKFLDRCSANPEMYPLSELWDIAKENDESLPA
jgi:hypothetical protein